MQEKQVELEKMNAYAIDLVQMIVKDSCSIKDDKLKIAFENVARAMIDMTNIHLKKEKGSQETLKTTLSKMKIAHNCIYVSNKTISK
ncbi:hypothetical protein [Sutcliffiella rhizosphaerae]|uniref:Uncharacterized protein n=1 Tax=Sutcliffiella rhizosphaerae TaxID=2880967 RepID=A0ABM8YKY8_9BACI|nr:hypothetical protein [Sutcliffiella rhizosphaerae]CAG9620605.1 hypothetical protein BACCIP111883_01374 [Sutcliffiella rhizosphaerae]